MISKTNNLIDNPHNVAVFNHVKVEYGYLVVSLVRDGNSTQVTITYNGDEVTVNQSGEISHYLTITSKHDFERLLRNYTTNKDSVIVFNDEKFLDKFYNNIISVH